MAHKCFLILCFFSFVLSSVLLLMSSCSSHLHLDWKAEPMTPPLSREYVSVWVLHSSGPRHAHTRCFLESSLLGIRSLVCIFETCCHPPASVSFFFTHPGGPDVCTLFVKREERRLLCIDFSAFPDKQRHVY